MNRATLFAFLFFPLLASAALLSTARTWEFMQSVGGVGLGKPVFEHGAWRLPLLCDVSGTTRYTVKPVRANSGLAVADVIADTSDEEISITIKTGPVGIAGKSAACGAAHLANTKAGRYRVVYRDPNGNKNPIGEVELGI